MPKVDGYRYVRSYHVTGYVQRWALWEVRNGRSCRVGTARTDLEYLTFLFGPEEMARKILDKQANIA